MKCGYSMFCAFLIVQLQRPAPRVLSHSGCVRLKTCHFAGLSYARQSYTDASAFLVRNPIRTQCFKLQERNDGDDDHEDDRDRTSVAELVASEGDIENISSHNFS